MEDEKYDLQFVQNLLLREIELLKSELKTGLEPSRQAEVIGQINSIRLSQQPLRRCAEYGILPRAVWRRVPMPQHQWSEYRIMQDFDTDATEAWQEMPHMRLHGGEVVIG